MNKEKDGVASSDAVLKIVLKTFLTLPEWMNNEKDGVASSDAVLKIVLKTFLTLPE